MIRRVLIVGLGSIGRRHLSVIRQTIPKVQIAALQKHQATDLDASGIARISSLAEARHFSPEVVLISNAATGHVQTAFDLIETGAHFFVEKPLSSSTKGVVELVHEVKIRGKILTVGYNLRYLNSLNKYRTLIQQGVIGKPLSVRCEAGQFLPSWRSRGDYRDSVSAKSELGGGVLLELSHELDYLRWIFGEVDWVRATMLHQSKLQIDVEDTVHLILGFCNSTGSAQLVGSVNLDFIRHDQSRRCVAIGEKGTLTWDAATGEVALFEEGGKAWETLFTNDNGLEETYFLEWQNFLQAIKSGTKTLVSGEDGLRVIEIVEAIRKSGKTGEQTRVNRSLLENDGKS
jgi:predicted dehydrogenase